MTIPRYETSNASYAGRSNPHPTGIRAVTEALKPDIIPPIEPHQPIAPQGRCEGET